MDSSEDRWCGQWCGKQRAACTLKLLRENIYKIFGLLLTSKSNVQIYGAGINMSFKKRDKKMSLQQPQSLPLAPHYCVSSAAGLCIQPLVTKVPEEDHRMERQGGHHFVSCNTVLTNRLYLDLAHRPNLTDFP